MAAAASARARGSAFPCAAGGVFGVEGPVAHRGAQALAVEAGQPGFQRLEGVAQLGQGLVGGAVQPGGPARGGAALSGQGQADQRVGGKRLRPHAPGQVQ